ncbi:hypothetical protein CLAFUW4_00552 [Fulvia fulva]|uniref:Uncharacterized protein n=1 Tax=Passalora fulva TaxID=5499 RepID=A0A9Q8L5R6_PASFU|nr:uncharacterized protein CLAFUR5_00552 [Fulvia fulva]KAK4635071.1 hypothetical protein CLAFUR4_00553 [Fulvia fulva]KAK4638634.1 hypothetical protein CLAFUR0_00554 [Fulvia fulva]UJO11343.1 hypothetical protein CLAFUR5_00552 [Fulvia fulva]WPV09657.1 hypothetical protein CLAFUW4_00552 [Fulvia fulva]
MHRYTDLTGRRADWKTYSSRLCEHCHRLEEHSRLQQHSLPLGKQNNRISSNSSLLGSINTTMMEARSRRIPRSVPVPARNPSRKGSTKRPTPTTPTGLTEQQIHIWEHAITLYYGFDWQAAADTFASLARSITSDLEQALCLINTALICARLGDFAPALAILGESQPTKEVLPLTLFLMGHMNFALCELDQAESDFDSALRTLDNRPQSYRRYNVDFVLQEHHIRRSLEVLHTYRRLGSCNDMMDSLPADCIFGMPGSGPDCSPARSVMSTGSDECPDLTDFSDVSAPATPTVGTPTAEQNDVEMLWQIPMDEPEERLQRLLANSSLDDKSSRLEMILDVPDPIRIRLTPPRSPTPIRAASSAVPNVATYQPTGLPPRVPPKSRLRMEPRDARVEDGTTRYLAAYIRDLPAQGNALQPKEAKDEQGSTRHIVDFIRDLDRVEKDQQHTVVDYRTRRSESSDGSSKPGSLGSIDLYTADGDHERLATTYKPVIKKHRYRSGLGSVLSRKPAKQNDPTPSSSDTL